MFKRKNESDEFDDANFNLYDDVNDVGTPRRKLHPGCILLIFLGIVVLGVAIIGVVRKNADRTARNGDSTTTVSPIIAPIDGSVASELEINTGLVRATYNSSGQRTSLTNLNGETVSDDNLFIPVSMPRSLSGDSLGALDQIAYPEGAIIDPQSGQLVVFGKPAKSNSHPSSDDFLTTLRAIYSKQDPKVSIDPAGSKTVQNVRYFGQTDGTHFGWVMFESDRLMKTLSMGQDNITGQIITSAVPGHSTLLDLEFQIGDNKQNETLRRFWFTVPVAEIEQTDDGQSMVISALSLDVKTEYLDSNGQTLANQPPDPAGQAFARQLTEHYDEYAQEFPVLSDLKALARWTALAHWLKQANLPIQPELWLTNSPAPYDAPLTTPAITVTQQNTQGKTIRKMTLWGGVDLGMTIKIHQAREATVERLKQLFDSFKAMLKMGRLNVSPAGVAFAPLAPLQIERGLTFQVDLPLALAPKLQCSSAGWKLRVPALRRQSAEQATPFIFDDPALQTPVSLLHAGVDSKTNAEIYVNEPAGLWLTVASNGYTLSRGEFQTDGKFSPSPNDLMVFGLEGNILEDVKAGVKYTYQDAHLTHILQGEQDLEITWDKAGHIRQMRQSESKIDFKYDKDFLVAMQNEKGTPIRKFEYDGQGRITRETSADANLEHLIRYDASGRLLFQVENGQGTLYDWRADGTPALFSGQALTPWAIANEKDLGEFTVGLRLLQDAEVKHLFFARHIGNSIVMFANERSYTLPDYMLKNPAGLRTKLASLTGQDQQGEMVLVSSAGIEGVAFQNLFPKAIPLNVETMDEIRIRENIKLLRDPLKFNPDQADVINALPQPGELAKVQLDPSKSELWYAADSNGKPQTFKDFLDQKIAQAGFGTFLQPATLERVKKALSTFPSVLIVVGHSDGQYIYLPDGTKFSPGSLSRQEVEKIAANHTLLLFVDCEIAAKLNGEASLSQQFLELGFRQVVAPNGTIRVQDANDILQAFLENPDRESNALQAFIQAVLKVFPDGLIPSDDGLEHFFEFRTQKVSPTV